MRTPRSCRALVASFGYADTALIERFVSGTELTVAVLDPGDGPQALPAVEIDALGGRYDYAARYTAGSTEFYVPARLPAAVGRGRRRAVAAHQVLGLADLSRTDCIVSGDGVVFLEVNVSPGMTETSLVPLAVTRRAWTRRDLPRSASDCRCPGRLSSADDEKLWQ